jgi:hypothetical protein
MNVTRALAPPTVLESDEAIVQLFTHHHVKQMAGQQDLVRRQRIAVVVSDLVLHQRVQFVDHVHQQLEFARVADDARRSLRRIQCLVERLRRLSFRILPDVDEDVLIEQLATNRLVVNALLNL